ncbi:MAG: DUF4342 domain-containing protein [Chloroflexi bacterium]|nr:DUF4342 domain-containing protein [Chloroflexota bacterium]MDL1917241.1 DUF4342 domain-containing protein [Anaerolineae bacterium CFX4]OQY82568.1 MAG: hypothetical protein B6D42_09125 [Anaerolineae bacterium UTCFX5]RIK20576.1 MAG: hypothetical protein DCC53_09980 [Chloroflexota bacterium]
MISIARIERTQRMESLTMSDEKNKQAKTITEELEGVGNQVVEHVQELIRQGNVRRLIIKTADDRVLIDTTLTVGAIAGTVLGLMAGPIGAIIAAVGATVARLKIEIVREITDSDVTQGGAKSKIDIKDE